MQEIVTHDQKPVVVYIHATPWQGDSLTNPHRLEGSAGKPEGGIGDMVT